MKFDLLLSRVKGMLLQPKAEWPQVAAEPVGIVETYKRYVFVLAAIPAVFQFIKGSVIGYGVFHTTWRVPFFSGLLQMVVYYLLSLVMVFLVALLVDALAPTFGGKRNREQAFKTVAYAWTAVWVVSVAVIVPWLGALIAIAGGLYSIYLLYVGLPHTMGCPPEKRLGYTASIIVASVLLSVVVSMIAGQVAGSRAFLGGTPGTYASDKTDATGEREVAGSLAAMSRMMQVARDVSGDDPDVASSPDNGDDSDQLKSLENMFTEAAEGKSQRPVEALASAKLKTLLPEHLGDMTRKSISAERNSAMGMQNSEAEATYMNDAGNRLKVHIEDHAGLASIAGLAASMASESEKQTDHGYSRQYRRNGQMVAESWDDRSHNGRYSTQIYTRFNVTVSGKAQNMGQIKSVMQMLDLAQLEKWAAEDS